MEKKILVTGNEEENIKHENKTKSNIFQGRKESEDNNAKFPDWDIVPPNQFINPRIKLK